MFAVFIFYFLRVEPNPDPVPTSNWGFDSAQKRPDPTGCNSVTLPSTYNKLNFLKSMFLFSPLGRRAIPGLNATMWTWAPSLPRDLAAVLMVSTFLLTIICYVLTRPRKPRKFSPLKWARLYSTSILDLTSYRTSTVRTSKPRTLLELASLEHLLLKIASLEHPFLEIASLEHS